MMKPYTYEKIYLKDQQVGSIRSDGMEFVTIRNEAHFFRRFSGFALNKEVFKLIKERGVHKIRIKYLRNNGLHETWQVSLPYFEEKSVAWHNGKEEQLVLNQQFWYKRGPDGEEITDSIVEDKFTVIGNGQMKLVKDEKDE